MKKQIRIILFMCFCIALSMTVFAQDKNKTATKIHIEMKDGNDFIGNKISETNEIIKLNTEKLGDITIKKNDISKMEVITDNQIQGDDFWYENPNSTRYLFAPSAYALKKGEGYYQNNWVFLNQVSYGFTDKFTMGLGTLPLFLIDKSSASSSPFWITPKYTFLSQEKKTNFAVGGFYFFFPFVKQSQGDIGSAGILYGTSTIGNRDKNISFGLGWGFLRDRFNGGGVNTTFAKRPTLNLSGMFRVGKRSYIVSENWLVYAGDEHTTVGSAAYRFAAKSVSIDIGLIGATGLGIRAIPWLGVVLPFHIRS